MDAVSGAIGLSPSKVVPLGLGIGAVESLTGYAARMSARIAVPTLIFVGQSDSAVAAAVARLTGHSDPDRLSYFAFLDLFGVGDRGVLVLHRRWCPDRWSTDGEEPYERKVWWLVLVDVCHLHGCLLESRCPVCGRRQPTLPRAVRIHVCSYCGHDLWGFPVVPGTGPVVERMLWYAPESARSVHAGEAIALSGSDETESLTLAYGCLAELARQRDLPVVERFFFEEIQRAVGSKLEALMSGLWRLQASVLELFSPAVEGNGGRAVSCRCGRPVSAVHHRAEAS